jgi:hypothetical protein
MKKLIIVSSILLILGLLLGWWFGSSRKGTDVIERVDTIYEHSQNDSLVEVIKDRDKAIDSLKENVRVIREVQYRTSKELRSLGVDSSVVILRGNLDVSDSDTFPRRVVSTLTLDTLVEVSPVQVQDINIAFNDLESERKVVKEYEGVIREDSIIRLGLEAIIDNKNSIIKKVNSRTSSLEKSLKKEKRRKNRNTIIAGSLAVILGLLNFTH